MGKEEVFGKLLKCADACVFSVNLWFIKDHLSVNRTRSKRKEAYQDTVGSCSSLHWTCLSSHNPIFSVQSFRAAPKSLLWSWTSGQERMLYLVLLQMQSDVATSSVWSQEAVQVPDRKEGMHQVFWAVSFGFQAVPRFQLCSGQSWSRTAWWWFLGREPTRPVGSTILCLRDHQRRQGYQLCGFLST